MNYRIDMEQDNETGDWAIWCPELPGCTSAGNTKIEALENIYEAIDLYLDVAGPMRNSSSSPSRD